MPSTYVFGIIHMYLDLQEVTMTITMSMIYELKLTFFRLILDLQIFMLGNFLLSKLKS